MLLINACNNTNKYLKIPMDFSYI